MQQTAFQAKPRQRVAKGDNRKLRREGLVPAVIYGSGGDPVTISIPDHEMELILRGAYRSTIIFQLEVEGNGTEQTIIREVQRHPVSEKLIHIDFQRVDVNKSIHVEVPVHLVGADPIGVKEGGLLEHVTRTVNIRCKPLEIPARLDVDISQLGVGMTHTLGLLTPPEGVEFLDPEDTPLFTIVAPKAVAEEEAEEGEGEEAAEPEVIGEKKEEGDEE